MFKLLLACILALGPSLAWSESLCHVADEAIKEASRIRGLKQKKKVPCLIQGKDEVEKYIVSAIKEKIPAQKLHWEGMAYKTLGFIPETFDYEKGLVDLYVSQLGGYYEPTTDHYVMAGWMPEALQAPIAAHELTHALQDQYFDLTQYTDDKKYTSDELMSRSAVVEGDATAVMMDFSRNKVGQGSIAKDPDVESIMLQNVIGGAFMVGTTGVPQSLQSLLIFPYTSGLRFAHSLLLKGGYAAINRAMTNPPRSTEEILHPEKYGSSKPDFVQISPEEIQVELKLPEKLVYSDVYGEFGVSALLTGYESNKVKVATAAAGWGGDRVAVFQTEDGKATLAWKTSWDTEQDRKEFAQQMRIVLEKRYAIGKEKPSIGTAADGAEKIKLLEQGNTATVLIKL